MLLVDALYLNSPGGLTLLRFLHEKLVQHEIKSFLLLDKRINIDPFCRSLTEVVFLESTLRNRLQFYQNHENSFSIVLCFSNIPPPVSLSIPVYTFFQNVLLLQNCHYLSFNSRLLSYLKRKMIYYYRKNSDTWIVQTRFMKQLMVSKLRIQDKNIVVLPFFDLPEQSEPVIISKRPDSFIYPSTGLGHKNHLVLLKAWELLYKEGYNFELHLTIPESDNRLIKLISNLNSKGLNIKNHGIIARNELIHLYQLSEYLVYPSLNESFGLPLMEAIQQNCKVISADLPYSKETIIPTALFNPYQPSSLKNVILETISHKKRETKSEIIAENKIDTLIELLKN